MSATAVLANAIGSLSIGVSGMISANYLHAELQGCNLRAQRRALNQPGKK